MPRTGAQYEAMRADTRRRIEIAAVRLFARQGFAATNVRDIAREAGISTGLMYRHYRTKDDLFGDLVAQAADGLGALARRFRSDLPPAVLIGEFTREYVHDVLAGGGFVEFLLIMNQSFTMTNPPAQVRTLKTRHTTMMRGLVELIERGQRLGQFNPGDAAELASCYFAALGGMAMMNFTLGEAFVAPGPELLTSFLLKEVTDAGGPASR
ncbi:TetR/AcrR family transcriptional regulator [Amycolatopsis sp. NPDC057786]|uniref:TetR/AcrR family transcriptional regulator n=1 Tax=Amycolatopsis sp. NPDC057786 TaxID=3346250 RepID=UPI00366B50BA